MNHQFDLSSLLEDKNSVVTIGKGKRMLRSEFVRELLNLDQQGYELPADMDEDAKRAILQTRERLKESGRDVSSLFSREKLDEIVAGHHASRAARKLAGLSTDITQKAGDNAGEPEADGMPISFQTAVFTKSGVESGYPGGVAAFLAKYPLTKKAKGLLGITSMSSGELSRTLDDIAATGLDLPTCCVVAEMFVGPYQSCEGICFQRQGTDPFCADWMAFAC